MMVIIKVVIGAKKHRKICSSEWSADRSKAERSTSSASERRYTRGAMPFLDDRASLKIGPFQHFCIIYDKAVMPTLRQGQSDLDEFNISGEWKSN